MTYAHEGVFSQGVFAPKIKERTAWDKAGCKAMRRIAKIGYGAWLEEQLDNPYMPKSPDWCRFIASEAANLPAEESP